MLNRVKIFHLVCAWVYFSMSILSTYWKAVIISSSQCDILKQGLPNSKSKLQLEGKQKKTSTTTEPPGFEKCYDQLR